MLRTLGHAYPLAWMSVHHLLRDFYRKLLMKRNSLSIQGLTLILTESKWTLLKLTNTLILYTNTLILKNVKSWTWRKTGTTITKIDKYKKTEQKFYRGIQTWYEHFWKAELHFYKGTLSRTQLPFGNSNNKHMQI